MGGQLFKTKTKWEKIYSCFKQYDILTLPTFFHERKTLFDTFLGTFATGSFLDVFTKTRLLNSENRR